MHQRFKKLIIRYRLPFIVAFQFLLFLFSNYLAFWLRFDGDIPNSYRSLMVQMMPWLLLIRGGTFLIQKVYRGLWRYTSIWDLWKIVFATILSSVIFFFFVHF